MEQGYKSYQNENTSSSDLSAVEYTAILDSIPDVIFRCSLDGEITWWNQNLENLLEHPGFEQQEHKLKHLPIQSLISGPEDEALEQFIHHTIKNGIAEIEGYLATDTGNKLYYFKSTYLANEKLSHPEVLVVGRDIDERFRMSLIHKRSQAQHQVLIDTLPYLIFVISKDNKFVLINRQYSDFAGKPFDKIIGFNVTDIHSNEISEFLLKENEILLSSESPVSYEGMLEVSGVRKHYSVEKIPLMDEDDNIYAICGIAEDITRQYQLQRQLQQTQKMEAIGQLTGGIAHDFNNILASIMGHASLIRRRVTGQNDEKLDRYLNQLTSSGERASDLVKQLLAFSRGEVGGVQVVDPVVMARDAIEMLSTLIPSSIELSFSAPEDNTPEYIEVDPVQFHQGIMNLVINARDAIKDSSGSITVSIEYAKHTRGFCDSCHTAYSGKYIVLSVKDSGQGISQDIMGRIFDPFFTTKPVGKGSGMGLSMLHGIVHGSGGHISLHTSRNTGSTIQVLFPESSTQKVIEEPAVGYREVNHEDQGENKKKTIMIVDDEPLITTFMHDLLGFEGYSVETFNNPSDAYTFVEEHVSDIDLVITDQTMPGLTGVELAKKITQINPDMPVILCSGYNDVSNQSAYSENGIDFFIDKPFDDKVLLSKIKELIEN